MKTAEDFILQMESSNIMMSRECTFNGNTYTDSEFGHHYALNKSGVMPVKDKEEVFIRLKEWLNR